MAEFISSEHNEVWKVLNRSNYSASEAVDIEKMYNFLLALKDYAGTKTINVLAMYSEVYSEEMSKISTELCK